MKEEDLKIPNKVIQLGFQPERIDIFTSISGVYWDDAFKKHDKGEYGNIPVKYIGKEHYVF